MASNPSQRYEATFRRGTFTIDPTMNQKVDCVTKAIDMIQERQDIKKKAEETARTEIRNGLAMPTSPWLIVFILVVIVILSIFVRMVVLRFSADEKRLLDYARPTLNNVVFSFVLVMVGQMLLIMLNSTSTIAAALDSERLSLVAVREAFARMPAPWNRLALELSTVPSVAVRQIQILEIEMDRCGIQFPSRDYVYPLMQGLLETTMTVKVQFNVLARTDQNTLLALAVLLFMTFSLFSLSRATPEGAMFAVSLLAAAIVAIILIVQSQRSALTKRITNVVNPCS